MASEWRTVDRLDCSILVLQCEEKVAHQQKKKSASATGFGYLFCMPQPSVVAQYLAWHGLSSGARKTIQSASARGLLVVACLFV